MSIRRVSNTYLSAFLATTLLVLVPTLVLAPTPVRAETILFKCVKQPNGHVLPMRITFDSVAKKVTYQVLEADGVTPWSKVGVVSATIKADTISWNANPSTDVPTRKYSLDQKTNIAVATDIENGGTKRIVWDKWVCQRSK